MANSQDKLLQNIDHGESKRNLYNSERMLDYLKLSLKLLKFSEPKTVVPLSLHGINIGYLLQAIASCIPGAFTTIVHSAMGQRVR